MTVKLKVMLYLIHWKLNQYGSTSNLCITKQSCNYAVNYASYLSHI